MIVAIGSTNPAKVSAVRKAFEVLDRQEVEFVAAGVASGVKEQPFSDEETLAGAVNRSKAVLAEQNADIGIGLEGGVVETPQGLFLCNWGALAAEGREPFVAGGARIPLPDEIAGRLRAGEELGPVMEEYAKKENVRKKEGAIGVFTNELVTRGDMFTHITKMLLGQYLYQKSKTKASK
ncbi:DUF84 family protein [Heyndrickxia acidiproducens]|uniref:DUF84 family protein n=1 Tax=Heyndrickxia acidiproducens TaxID=1121084 RepID=UPI000367D011|nr:DUF84 family protein [Heyndrickxia acidiproducens]